MLLKRGFLWTALKMEELEDHKKAEELVRVLYHQAV
jgi:hypothetical protein